MSTSSPTPTKTNASPDRYAALLAEASSIRGVSLWQDAWKRLKRNWAAMISLVLLAITGLLALFTPMLPLQSPTKIELKTRQFQPPNLTPYQLGIEKHRNALAELDELIETAPADKRKSLEDKRESDRKNDPVIDLKFKKGPITSLLIDARVAIFGDYCIPSLLGTDHLGRDLLARIFWGGRVSLVVALVAGMVSLVIGVAYGATAGYIGGVTDSIMMRLVDVLYSIPFIFVVIFIITLLSEPKINDRLELWGINRIIILYILIGAIYWLTMARVVRGQVLSLKNEQYIEAARTIGAGRMRIIFRHLVPNVLGVVIVYLTLTIPSVMLFEAFLSFLGLGVAPPDVSWGILVDDGVKVITPIRIYWWLVFFPGLTFALTLFALNFLGDGLRDALDPRLKNK